MRRSQLALLLISLPALAYAQVRPGNLLLNSFQSPDLLVQFRPDSTVGQTTPPGIRGEWEGARILPNGDGVSTRPYHERGVNIFDGVTGGGGASAPPSWTGGNPANSSANLIVNGDFENHAFGNSCQYNLSNSAFTAGMANCTGFGSAEEIDVMSDPAGCFGIPAISGLTKIGIHRKGAGGKPDAFAMELTAGVVAGSTYAVSGWVQSETSFTSDLGVLEIGLGTAGTFGALVAAVPSNIGWNAFSVIFVAPVSATHLTVTEGLNFEGWLHIDGFCLEDVGDDIGTNYCGPANFNSTGQSAVISAFGSTTASVKLLILTAGQLPPNVFGYFLNSDVRDFKPFPPGSKGNLCLGGSIGRHAQQIGNSGAAGELVIDVDLTALPRPNGTHSVVAGETWNFQCWFRDNVGGPTSNFTDGIEIVFQ